MISVREALDHVFALARPVGTETIPLRQAAGRVLAKPVTATRAQPPFATSTMDGYAIATDTVAAGDRFTVIGESDAGHRFKDPLTGDQAVRIFTGAPVPEGTRRVIIQEDVSRNDNTITITGRADSSIYIRPVGSDFNVTNQLQAPRILSASDIALIAAMNVPEVTVSRKPNVALIATGDELVLPGEAPGPDQIVASNALGLAAMLEANGATARILPIARDTVASLTGVLELATGADLIVTIGGASVGDHDLVGKVAEERGLRRSFYKIAMRPGKPLMAGRMEGSALLGLPGNPVSSIVCGRIFMLPMLRAMMGLPAEAAPVSTAQLANTIPANGPREHYMRARVEHGPDGPIAFPYPNQDSSILSVLAAANALIVRPPRAPEAQPGEMAEAVFL